MTSKTGLLCETYNQFSPLSEKYWKIGYNTGNLLFFSALNEIIECSIVRGWERDTLKNLDKIISTEFIWIREGAKPTETSKFWLDHLDAALIPISIGLQAPDYRTDFRLTSEMTEVLSAAQERAILLVRGDYTASILEKHGIKNLAIVGCPSMYQIPLYHRSLDFLLQEKQNFRTIANYKTFISPLKQKDDEIIRYITEKTDGFVEQTLNPLGETNLCNNDYVDWYSLNTNLFFDLESWIRFCSNYDFSIGARFHGNVAAILSGARSSFISVDSRTREMVKHFDLPAVEISDFDVQKDLSYYYDLADYRIFVTKYKLRTNEFCSALLGNGLALRDRFSDRLKAFEFPEGT